jgi:hypothetical protein
LTPCGRQLCIAAFATSCFPLGVPPSPEHQPAEPFNRRVGGEHVAAVDVLGLLHKFAEGARRPDLGELRPKLHGLFHPVPEPFIEPRGDYNAQRVTDRSHGAVKDRDADRRYSSQVPQGSAHNNAHESQW